MTAIGLNLEVCVNVDTDNDGVADVCDLCQGFDGNFERLSVNLHGSANASESCAADVNASGLANGGDIGSFVSLMLGPKTRPSFHFWNGRLQMTP